MNELAAKFAKIPLAQKLALLVILLGGIGVAYYFLVYDDQMERKQKLQDQLKVINVEKEKLKVIAKEKIKYEKRLEDLEDKRKKALALLPEDAQFEELTVELNRRARQAQIRITKIDQLPEVPSGYFARVPAQISLEGTFHQLVIFFNLVSEMKRIVNIQDVVFTEPKRRDGQVYLRAMALATSFHSMKEPVRPPEPPAAVPAGRGIVEKGKQALKKRKGGGKRRISE
jgi:type IV pilus assembly protein PilO